jgi:hypothetical protein
MGVTFEVRDPESGERTLLHAYRRNGRVLLRRLPKHLFIEHATPRRLEHIIAFSEAAASAFGGKGTRDGLPPAAAAVQRALKIRAEPESAGRIQGADPQESLRSLIPGEQMARIEELAALPARFRLESVIWTRLRRESVPRGPPER